MVGRVRSKGESEMDASRAAGVSCPVIASLLVHGQEPDRVTRRWESLKVSTGRRSVQRCSDISWQMEGLLRAAAVERGGGGGLVGLLGGGIGSFGQWAALCSRPAQLCTSSQCSASRTPVGRIAHWTRSSTARAFAWPSPFRASPTFLRRAELVGECRRSVCGYVASAP